MKINLKNIKINSKPLKKKAIKAWIRIKHFGIRKVLVIFCSLIILVGAYYLIQRIQKNLRPPQTAATFQDKTTYQFSGVVGRKWNIKNLDKDLKKRPNKVTVYTVQNKPYDNLHNEDKINKLISFLGFTDKYTIHSGNESATWAEKGKELTINLIGSKINYSVGLNLEPQYLDTTQTVDIASLQQTADFFINEYKFIPEFQIKSYKVSYSKMGQLGLYAVNGSAAADVATFINTPMVDNLEIAPSSLTRYTSISKTGKIVAFSSSNATFTANNQYPILSLTELKQKITNNEMYSFDLIASQFLNPTEGTVNEAALVYYYNDSTQLLTPAYQLRITVKNAQNDENRYTLYVPALDDSYYQINNEDSTNTDTNYQIIL